MVQLVTIFWHAICMVIRSIALAALTLVPIRAVRFTAAVDNGRGQKGRAMKKKTLCAATLTILMLAAGQAWALPVWGLDNGTEFEISATNNGGTSYGSIDAAVTAGLGLTRTVVEFQGTFTGIDETIDLRNVAGGLTYQGAAGSSMTWNSGVIAFGAQDQTSTTVTIKDMNITTSGAGGYGVSWVADGTGDVGSLTLQGTTLNSVDTAIRFGDLSTSPHYRDPSASAIIRNSVITSTAGSGVIVGANDQGGASLAVYDTRVEAAEYGLRLHHTGTGTTNTLHVERAEIVGTGGGTDDGIYIINNSQSDDTTIVDTLIAGFDNGIFFRPRKNTGYSSGEAANQSLTLLNSTVVDNNTGVNLSLSSSTTSNGYTYPDVYIINSIFAGNNIGMLLEDLGAASVDIDLYGDNNAFFANATADVQAVGTVNQNDVNRLTPAYLLTAAFLDPSNGDYHLLATATVLLDTGEMGQSTVLGSGTQSWLDYNNNNSYDAGVDYIVDLGGYAGDTTGHNLLLLDADIENPTLRLVGVLVDIGAYEYTAPVPEPATLVLLGIGGLAMAGTAMRHRRR